MTKVRDETVTVKLGELGVLHCGQSPSSAEVNEDGNGELYVTGPEQYRDGKLVHKKWTTNPKRIAPDGCIFITVKGSVGTIFRGHRAAIGRDIYAFEPFPEVDPNYVYFAILESIASIKRGAKGDIPGISKPDIVDHEILFLGPQGQAKLVAKIEALFSRLEEGVAALRGAKARLKLYRQSLLKAAFEGRLTETWRRQNPHLIEPPETLLSRIRTEREAAHKQALADWQEAVRDWECSGRLGPKPRKPAASNDFDTITQDEREPVPPIPKEWLLVRLGEVSMKWSRFFGQLGSVSKVYPG